MKIILTFLQFWWCHQKSKVATLRLLKGNVCWNKGCEVFVSDVTNKMLSRELNCIVDAVMWPKLSNANIYMTKGLDQKNNFFLEGWSWFKFNNLGLSLGMGLKFYTNVAKRIKVKVRKFLGLTPTFAEITGVFLAPLPSWTGLNTIN